MLVAEDQQKRYVVTMFLATAGAGEHLLGSDEKEIIYLVFGIIDLQKKETLGIKQYLVRPVGTQCIKTPVLSPNTSTTSSENGSIASSSATTEPLISEAVLQSAGRTLADVLNEFDTYLRSLKIEQFCLVTDGQLPLRQCLHPEASAKDIDLPPYYWKFSDLKKEYACFKYGDLSKALVAANDTSIFTNASNVLPSTFSVAEMMKEIKLNEFADNEFYIKESRDMITIVQSMMNSGHVFEAKEIINMSLEAGINSIDDDIDGNCIVRARGLPWQSSDQDIAKFFRGLNVAKGGVALCLSPQGRRNGEALIRFVSQEHRDMALKRHKHHIGSRYIEVYRASGEDFLAVAGGASNEAQTFLSKGAQVIIRMRGLPYDCSVNQVLEFFANGENSCKVLDDSEGILFVKKPDGRSTGDAFVLFSEETDAPKALSKHRESIGQRYIELFRSTIAEVQQVLNRSMDPKTYELATPKPPLIAQIPPTISQMPMLPQHVITSGTEKNCIRLRGLPYEAKVEHILHFLEDFAKHIVYQGVHLVYNAQGQFNGEAFIQMDSEVAAQACADQKHHKHMMFGKKQRYIEVFQCSGEDMNLVLNGGGYHGGFSSPPSISAKPLVSSGNNFGPPTRSYAATFNPFATLPPTNVRTVPAIFQSSPQLFYWGYPNSPHNSPISSAPYFGPLQIPPQTFTHFTSDRATLLAVDDSQLQLNDSIELQASKAGGMSGGKIQYVNNILDHQKAATNVTYHNDNNENIIEDNNQIYYHSKDFGHSNKNITNEPIPHHQDENQKHQQPINDLNNNIVRSDYSSIELHNYQSQIFHHKQFPSHIFSPLNINTQFNQPLFVNPLNMIHSPFFSSPH